MKQNLVVILIILGVFVLPGYVLGLGLKAVMCPVPEDATGFIAWSCAQLDHRPARFAILITCLLYIALMGVAMIVLRLTHGMPFNAWCDWQQFFDWITKIRRGNKKPQTNAPMTDAELQQLLRQAVAKVTAEGNARHAEAAKYTDDQFFDAIVALPDRSFKMIACKIGKATDFEEEKGMKWYISGTDLPGIAEDTAQLTKMGLLMWYPSGDGSYMHFDQYLIDKRFGRNSDGIKRLHDEAIARDLSVMWPSYYDPDLKGPPWKDKAGQ
jgi:hypothetical protein